MWDDFGQSILVQRKPRSENEYRQRTALLSKVKGFWIEGFFKRYLYANTAINLYLKSRPDELHRPFEGVKDIPIELIR